MCDVAREREREEGVCGGREKRDRVYVYVIERLYASEREIEIELNTGYVGGTSTEERTTTSQRDLARDVDVLILPNVISPRGIKNIRQPERGQSAHGISV